MTDALPTEPTAWQRAKPIMEELGETEHQPRVQLSRAIEVLGLDVVEAVVVEARTAEVNGGLLRKDGQRRTLGGVFFALLKRCCTPEQRKRIFWVAQPKKKQPVAPPVAPAMLPPPSEQAVQIAGVIVEKLKISQKQQTSIAHEVDRVGVQTALAALRAALKVEHAGGRQDADGKPITPVQLWLNITGSVRTS